MWTMKRGRHWEKMVSDLCLCSLGICYFGANGVISETRAWLLWLGKSEEALHKTNYSVCGSGSIKKAE